MHAFLWNLSLHLTSSDSMAQKLCVSMTTAHHGWRPPPFPPTHTTLSVHGH